MSKPHMHRRGNVLLVVVGLSTLMLTLTLALTVKVQADMQSAYQIRKFSQAYLLASTVHTRWPRLKATPDVKGADRISVFMNFWDLSASHPTPKQTDPDKFLTPPALLGYCFSEWRDVLKDASGMDRRNLLINGGNKAIGFNYDASRKAGEEIGHGFAYDYSLAFVCDPGANFPPGHALLSPADATFPRSLSTATGLRTGNLLSQVLTP
jgi:hypothetical protein